MPTYRFPNTPGRPAPLGATCLPQGVNFSVFAKDARAVSLLLFDSPSAPRPSAVLELDPARNRTSYYWHILVGGLEPGQVYAWRVDGPYRPSAGHLYRGDKVLLDPYGLAVTGQDIYDRQAARGPGDNAHCCLRSVVVDPDDYDWEDDQPLPRDQQREIIYELHVGGFTAEAACGLAPGLRGTYAGLAAKAPYLKNLGVTAVELMPVHEFDVQDAPEGRRNVWGYSSLSFFAPHSAYSSDRNPLGPVREFRDMVKALHRAGLKVILDVVYNHTAEGGPDGPTLCWRGFENKAYYMLQEDMSLYADYTGCGNTFNANHSIARRLILASLRHWVHHMHVDGFRFDLASALSRGEDGRPLAQAPVLWAIGSDPELVGATLIAEAWDAGGLYQLGSLPGDGFAQWNGAFRDDVRRFLRSDPGTIEAVMARIVGSSDLLPPADHLPYHSINYVTCHDGFTLQDLVSYDHKHNEANGEDNRDGSDSNFSWNCGVEGSTDDPAVLALRRRQMRNFLCMMLLSHGTPMLAMGDEVGHSRRGNNNPWCQDNALNHLEWGPDRDGALLRFTRQLIAFSKRVPALQRNRWWTATSPEQQGEITWHGLEPGKPDWSDQSRQLAWTLSLPGQPGELLVLANAGPQEARFTLPPSRDGSAWRLIFNTANDLAEFPELPEQATAFPEPTMSQPAHSISILWSDAQLKG